MTAFSAHKNPTSNQFFYGGVNSGEPVPKRRFQLQKFPCQPAYPLYLKINWLIEKDNMSPAKDRRRFSRIPFEATVMLSDGKNVWQSELLDISLKGVLIKRPDDWVPVGNKMISVSVQAPDDAFTIGLEGSVEHDEAQWIGIECHKIDIDSVTILRRLIELNLGDSGMVNREFAELCKHQDT